MQKKRNLFDDEWEWRAKRVRTKIEKIQQTYGVKYQPKIAQSSINLKLSKSYAFEHNSRTADDEKLEAKYTFKEFESLNEYSCTAKEARQKYDELLNEATQNYYERRHQKIQDNTNGAKFRWGCVVNINENHTLNDIENLADKLCEKYGWQKLQVAIHRDEGHYKRDENGEPKLDENGKKIFDPNLHAHIEFFMLDKQGNYRFKKRDFGKKTMSELQTFVAKELDMERGIVGSKTIRLEHKQYRQEARKQEILKAKNEKQKLTIKELNNTIKDLRGQLKENHATREDYAKLEQEAKELKEQLKKKELDRAEFEKQIALMQEHFRYKFEALQAEKDKSDKEKNEQIQNLQTQNEQLNAQISTLNEKIAKVTTQSDKTQENANLSLEQLFLKQIDEKGLKRPEYLQFYSKVYMSNNGYVMDIKEISEFSEAERKEFNSNNKKEPTEKLVISYYKRNGINETDIPLYPLQKAKERIIEQNKGFDYER